MKLKNLVVGETYEIRYIGPYDYTHFSGQGIYTGESQECESEDGSDKLVDPGFKIPNEKQTCFFPLKDIFSIEE